MPPWSVQFDLRIDLSKTDLVRLVERAQALAAVIREIPIPPHLRVQLDSINIMRAIRGTTAIEGAQVTPDEVRQIMASPQTDTLPAARRRDEQEVRNAQEVMFYIANLLREQPDCPVTQDLISTLHRLMTRGIRYDNSSPGVYRSHAVSAGTYQPPSSGEDVRRLMREFIEWFRSPPAVNWDPIVRALAAHFYLISIHPFADGNGRTSRALESFLLYQGRVNARGFYSLANFYYQNRSDYVWHLDNARFNAQHDLTAFILFGLQGLVSELEDIHSQVLDEVKLMSFRDHARETFFQAGKLRSRSGERLLNFLLGLGREPLPMSELRSGAGSIASSYRKVSQRTLQRDLVFLREHRLITIENDAIRANLDLMNEYTAIEEIQIAQGLAASEARKLRQ